MSRVKFRPLTWRNAHGYVLCDRVDDATPPSRLLADPKCDRTVDCYGYVRGAHLKAETRAGKESEIPNFKASYLGRFPLVSADFGTSDHLSERSRSVDAFSGTRVRGTRTLKRR